MYAYPKTRIGKFAFWLAVSGFVVIYAQYWLTMLLQDSGGFLDAGLMLNFKIALGILAMIVVMVAGVLSVIAITKHRDRAILLFVSAFIGCMGLLFILGEFLLPH